MLPTSLKRAYALVPTEEQAKDAFHRVDLRLALSSRCAQHASLLPDAHYQQSTQKATLPRTEAMCRSLVGCR